MIYKQTLTANGQQHQSNDQTLSESESKPLLRNLITIFSPHGTPFQDRMVKEGTSHAGHSKVPTNVCGAGTTTVQAGGIFAIELKPNRRVFRYHIICALVGVFVMFRRAVLASGMD